MRISKVISIMIRLDYIVEEQEYILNLIDFAYECLDDDMMFQDSLVIKGFNRAAL